MISVRRIGIGGFKLRRAADRGINRRRQPSRRFDGRDVVATSSIAAPSAAATEAVYALASVAAASATAVLGGFSLNNDNQAEHQLTLRVAPSSSSMSETRPPPPPPSSSRLLFVSLSIVSFLPYINFAAFACLAAIESFRNRKEEGKKKDFLFSLLLSPSALAGFALFYSLPFLLVALTTEGGGEASEHSVFAMESLVLGIAHFQAVRVAGERREREEEKRREAKAKAGADEQDDDEDREETSASFFASLAASELERFDARLGLKTAKASRLKELAQAAGVVSGKGRTRRKEEKKEGNEGGGGGGGGGATPAVPVARTKASLAAALAAACDPLEGSDRRSRLDSETREWLTSELAKEVEPLVARKRVRRRRNGRAAVAALEALEEAEEEREREKKRDDDGSQL